MVEGVTHVAMDIGCLECGAPSNVIGIGATFGEALELAEAKVDELVRDQVTIAKDHNQDARWVFTMHHRQHAIEILPVRP